MGFQRFTTSHMLLSEELNNSEMFFLKQDVSNQKSWMATARIFYLASMDVGFEAFQNHYFFIKSD
jgi:hypothetical protein